MVNPMCVPREDLVVQALEQYHGEKKLLDQWYQLINVKLPKHKRMSRRKVSRMIYKLHKREDIIVDMNRYQRNTYYTINIRRD